MLTIVLLLEVSLFPSLINDIQKEIEHIFKITLSRPIS